MKSQISGSVCEVEVCPDEGLVRKRIELTNQGVENGHDKLLHETRFMQEINEVERWFPVVLDQRYEGDELVVETEYLFSGESLADLMFDRGASDKYVLDSASYIVDTLYKKFYMPADTRIDDSYWDKCYLDRTRRRLAKTTELIKGQEASWGRLAECMKDGMTINGKRYGSAEDYLDLLVSKVDFAREFPLGGTFRTHHDLIPENIMIERGATRISDFRLIDPRGVYETGPGCRHFVYDAGKFLFGLDSYGLFRRFYDKGGPFTFSQEADGGYSLVCQADDQIMKRLSALRKRFISQFNDLAPQLDERMADPYRYLLMSYAFMYIPDVPCRVIDEGSETLTLLFYARGLMILHNLVVKLLGNDELSSDCDEPSTFI